MQISQMHLWQKQKKISEFRCAFFESTSNFELFQN